MGKDGEISIDPRLFLADSDHRSMWNEHPGVGKDQQAEASTEPPKVVSVALPDGEDDGPTAAQDPADGRTAPGAESVLTF